MFNNVFKLWASSLESSYKLLRIWATSWVFGGPTAWLKSPNKSGANVGGGLICPVMVGVGATGFGT